MREETFSLFDESDVFLCRRELNAITLRFPELTPERDPRRRAALAFVCYPRLCRWRAALAFVCYPRWRVVS